MQINTSNGMQEQLLYDLPLSLQHNLCASLYLERMRRVPYFAWLDASVLRALAQTITTEVLSRVVNFSLALHVLCF